MSQSRSLRRAAERRALKLARKQERLEAVAPLTGESAALEDVRPCSPEESGPADVESGHCPLVPEPLSPARLAANTRNAQLSTGPKTEAGKAKSSKNALRTALTGRTVLLPSDDADRYQSRLDHYQRMYQPVGVRETDAVQLLADTWWRLERIPGLLEALYARGSEELLDKVSHLDGAMRSAMLRAEAYLAYERQFRNLELQERRLFRQAEKLQAEIATLQKERIEREARDFSEASMLYLAAKKDRKPFDPASFGFEFSNVDIEAYLHGQRARHIAEQALKTGEITPSLAKRTA